MNFETETWVTAAGDFIVLKENEPVDHVALKIRNRGFQDNGAIWYAAQDIVDSPAFGGRRSQTVLRRRLTVDGKETEITLAINPAHVYAVRSTNTSTQ